MSATDNGPRQLLIGTAKPIPATSLRRQLFEKQLRRSDFFS
jgi:hypothetical protein